MSVSDVERERMHDLHEFCTDRALERMAAAGARSDRVCLRRHWRGLRILDVMYAEAKRHPGIIPRVTYVLHGEALRDQHHPDFRAQWTFGSSRDPLRGP